MFLIAEVLVSRDVFESQFTCDLNKCHGACCWEGDFGAPLTESEKNIIPSVFHKIRKFLSAASLNQLSKSGYFVNHPDNQSSVTPLMADGSCVYLIRNKGQIAQCSFEKANQEGLSDFRKPLSCHLYPLRISENVETGFEAINYDKWDICSPACSLGQKLSMPVFRFVKDAITRKYGEHFYLEMEQVYKDYSSNIGENSVI